MSVSTSILSVLSEVLKSVGTFPPNKVVHLDPLLKAANIELFANELGVLESRLKKVHKDKAIKKAEAAAAAAASAAPSAEPSAEPSAPATTEAKPKQTQKRAKKSDEALLAPVDAHVQGEANVLKPYQDAFVQHPSRLKVIDPTKCLGRKTEEQNPIAGTRKGDPGANGQYFPETQCKKKPVEGKLCDVCARKDVEAKADPTKQIPRWHGRLDEEVYWHAFVVGSKHFVSRYPNGISGDPLSVAAASTDAAAAAPAVVPAAKAKAKAKAPRAKKAKEQTTETNDSIEEKEPKEPKESKEPAEESVAVSEVAVKVCEWKTMFHAGQALIRNLKNNNVYEANLDFEEHEQMVKRDKFVGQWIDGDLDPYAEEYQE